MEKNKFINNETYKKEYNKIYNKEKNKLIKKRAIQDAKYNIKNENKSLLDKIITLFDKVFGWILK